ncbi:MAG: prepilin peptidase [Gammaproteobacteria bacterium]|nr:prepilin peptidase [Gammaproteobacteria bacterium]
MIEVLQSYAAIALPLTVIIGLLIGSFLNVVVYRMPIMLQRDWETQCAELREEAPPVHEPARFNLVLPHSSCPACGTRIRAWHNVPVISWLLLRGRCAYCGVAISKRYPIVEAATALFSMLVIWQLGATPQGLAALFFTWTLLAASLIDYDTTLLPDNLTLPLMWVGLLLALTKGGAGLFTDLPSAVLGAAFGYLSLWSVYWAFKLITGKEGMGYGDFKLLAALGAWLGWQMLPQIILLSAVVGAVIGITLMLVRGRDRNMAIPFGPYLAAAGWIALLWGEQINRLYLGSFGL